MSTDSEVTPIDIGCKIYRIYANQVLSYKQAKRDQGRIPVESLGKYTWYANETGVQIKRKFWGVKLQSFKKWGAPTPLGIFLNPGGLSWQATQAQRCLHKIICGYPEWLVIVAALILELCFHPQPGISEEYLAAKSNQPTRASLQPWVLTKSPIAKRTSRASKSKSIINRDLESIIQSANLAYSQGALKRAQSILEQNSAVLTTEPGAMLLAEIYYTYAYQALQSKDYLQSIRSCIKALKYQPKHDRALHIKEQVREHAKQLFMQAYVRETIEPRIAKKLYSEVILLLAPLEDSDPAAHYGLRSQQRIKRL